MKSSTTEPAPTPLSLWRILRAYIADACAMFGLPAAIAQKIWLTRAEHEIIAGWLRPLEALLRRLLFIDALELAPAAPAPESKARVKFTMPANSGAHFSIDDSQSWRVNFSLGASPNRQRAAGKPVRRTSPPLINVVSSAPLALRLEALIRGFNTRKTLAQRLANRLARAGALARALLAAPRSRDAARPGYHEVAQATLLARAARAKSHANDSS